MKISASELSTKTRAASVAIAETIDHLEAHAEGLDVLSPETARALIAKLKAADDGLSDLVLTAGLAKSGQ